MVSNDGSEYVYEYVPLWTAKIVTYIIGFSPNENYSHKDMASGNHHDCKTLPCYCQGLCSGWSRIMVLMGGYKALPTLASH